MLIFTTPNMNTKFSAAQSIAATEPWEPNRDLGLSVVPNKTKPHNGDCLFHFQFLSSSRASCKHEVPDSQCADVPFTNDKGDNKMINSPRLESAGTSTVLKADLLRTTNSRNRTARIRLETPNKRRVMIIRRLVSERRRLSS